MCAPYDHEVLLFFCEDKRTLQNGNLAHFWPFFGSTTLFLRGQGHRIKDFLKINKNRVKIATD